MPVHYLLSEPLQNLNTKDSPHEPCNSFIPAGPPHSGLLEPEARDHVEVREEGKLDRLRVEIEGDAAVISLPNEANTRCVFTRRRVRGGEHG